MRATPAQLTRVRAMNILIIPSPSVYIMTMASSMEGKASIISAKRMMTVSVRPPAYPASMPSAAPMSMERAVGTRPTSSDTREP